MNKPEVDEPCIAVPLKEWQRINRKIGFWEGVWIGVGPEVSDTLIEAVNKRYAEICGEVNTVQPCHEN
jgi:hypothetical protein